MSERLNIVGNKYNRLIVLSLFGIKKGKTTWECLCDCGNKIIVVGYAVKRGDVKSCGCLQKEQAYKSKFKHGKTRNTMSGYYSWINMKTRCYNKKNENYANYGAAGISVCDRWRKSFLNFYNDMGEKPTAEHSIDRIDNAKGYSPENCRWATIKEQANNKKKSVSYECAGLKKTLQGWSDYFGVSQGNLSKSLRVKGIDKLYKFYFEKHKGVFPDGEKLVKEKHKILHFWDAALAK